MTIESTTNKARFVGNAAATTWPYTFLIPDADSLGVYYTDLDGVTTLLSPLLYTVTGLNDPDGGIVTYPLSGSPIASGTILEILRTVPYTQTVDLINQDGFYPQVVETALDMLEMQIQQLVEIQGRNLTVGVTDTSPGELPSATERANQLLGFDSDGNAIAAQPSSALVSTAMAPVVSAASLAAGRTAFGLGTAAVEGIGSGLQDDGASNIRSFYPIVQDAGNKTVDVTYHATQHLATGAIAYSMPRANTLFNGFGFWISALTAAVTINVNAADNFVGMAGGLSLVIPPGTQAFVSTDAAASGTWSASFNTLVGLDSPLNLQLNATVSSNALTITVKDRNGNDPTASSPILLTFRNPTATSGGPITRVLTTSLSIVIPSTATLGTTSNNASRIWVVLFDNAGTLVLGVVVCSNATEIFPLDETTIQSPTLIGVGSTSAGAFYAASALTSKAFKILGYIESTQVTAGTWAAAPSKIQLFGSGVKKPGDIIQSVCKTLSGSTASAVITLTSICNLIRLLGCGAAGTGTSGSIYITNTLKRGSTSLLLGQAFQTPQASGAAVTVTTGPLYDSPQVLTPVTYSSVWNDNAAACFEVVELMG